MSLEFEWDNDKAASNLRRRRIDFQQAILVFNDPAAIDIHDDVHEYGEDRYKRIGFSGSKLLSIMYTLRGPDRVRIISARRATKDEEQNYRRQTRP
jgi:uncharacterized DUF497 family protein